MKPKRKNSGYCLLAWFLLLECLKEVGEALQYLWLDFFHFEDDWKDKIFFEKSLLHFKNWLIQLNALDGLECSSISIQKVLFKAHKYSIYIPKFFYHSKTSGEISFNVLAIENKDLAIGNKMRLKKCRYEKLAVTVT